MTSRTSLTPRERNRVASDLRMACMRISRRVRFESGEDIAPHQYSVLLRVEDQTRTPRELAEIERVSAPSMTRTVAALVDRGLVSRADDPQDGRSVIVGITDGGRAVLRATRARREAWMLDRIKHLSDDDQEILRQATAILERVAAQ